MRAPAHTHACAPADGHSCSPTRPEAAASRAPRARRPLLLNARVTSPNSHRLTMCLRVDPPKPLPRVPATSPGTVAPRVAPASARPCMDSTPRPKLTIVLLLCAVTLSCAQEFRRAPTRPCHTPCHEHPHATALLYALPYALYLCHTFSLPLPHALSTSAIRPSMRPALPLAHALTADRVRPQVATVELEQLKELLPQCVHACTLPHACMHSPARCMHSPPPISLSSSSSSTAAVRASASSLSLVSLPHLSRLPGLSPSSLSLISLVSLVSLPLSSPSSLSSVSPLIPSHCVPATDA